MSEKRALLAECRAVAKRMICQIEAAVGVNPGFEATMKLLEVMAALERLDNEIVAGIW